jgi:putative endonuclease
MSKEYYVYILTTKNNTVLYVGMTNDMERQIYEHKNKFVSGFTKKYNVTKLVYYERFQDIDDAIARENQIKSYKREKKIKLINKVNIKWKELDDDIW